MNGVTGVIMSYYNFVNYLIMLPSNILNAMVTWHMNILRKYFPSLKYLTLKTVRLGLIVGFFFWSSVIAYTLFYIFMGGYIPLLSNIIEYNIPISFNQQCEFNTGVCSFPNFDLTTKCAVGSCDKTFLPYLERGEIYEFKLKMEALPITQGTCTEKTNDYVMVASKLYTDTKASATSANKVYYPQALLIEPSLISKIIRLVFIVPCTIFGWGTANPTMDVELFSQFSHNENEQIAGLFMEIQSNCIHITSAHLIISSTFSGLRYYLFYHPIASTIFGIPIMMSFISCLFLLTWRRLIGLISSTGKETEKDSVISSTEEYENENPMVRRRI